MNNEIDKIVQADTLARMDVSAAMVEASRIIKEAQSQASTVAALQKARLAEAVAAEVGAILAEARSRAKQVGEEADVYLARINSRKQACLSDLLSRLVEKVTTP